MNPRKEETFYELTKTTNQSSHFFKPTEKEQENKLSKMSADALENAEAFAIYTLPTITATGIAMLTLDSKPSGAMINIGPMIKALGVPVTVGGIVLDVVKAPICLTVATEEAVRAGICKLASYVFDKRDVAEEDIEKIFKSFLMRMRQTATILEVLELEEKGVLTRKLESRDIEELVGLTLLHTAYASRDLKEGIRLSTGEILSKKDCPANGKSLFDKVTLLKNTIRQALHSEKVSDDILSEEKERADSQMVCKWIKFIKLGNSVKIKDMPGSNSHEVGLVNDIIHQIKHLKKLGMKMLPDSVESIERRMSR